MRLRITILYVRVKVNVTNFLWCTEKKYIGVDNLNILTRNGFQASKWSETQNSKIQAYNSRKYTMKQDPITSYHYYY